MPVYWRGDPALIPSSAPAKDSTRPSPARLEAWLKKHKAEVERRRGQGSHVGFTWRGRTGFFSPSRDPVPKQPCEQIAAIFGFPNLREFYLAVANNTVVA